jgi:enterochelin esterase-like enzyme
MKWSASFVFLLASGLLAQSTPCKSTVVGDLRVQTFQSKTFGDTQTLRIWLPPGYDLPANAHRTYPVLYMLDGQNLFDACDSFYHVEWQVDETLTRLIAAGRVQPIIVVGIDTPGDRRADQYLAYADPIFADRPAPHGALFPAFLADEVLPAVASRYRTIPDAEHRAIGGSSYGAAAALYALLQRPDLFGSGLLESTSLQEGNGELLRQTTSLAVGPLRVYVGVGTNELSDFGDLAKRFRLTVPQANAGFTHLSIQLATNLKAAAINRPQVKLVVTPGAKHQEKAWAARFPAAIQFLFPPDQAH